MECVFILYKINDNQEKQVLSIITGSHADLHMAIKDESYDCYLDVMTQGQLVEGLKVKTAPLEEAE